MKPIILLSILIIILIIITVLTHKPSYAMGTEKRDATNKSIIDYMKSFLNTLFNSNKETFSTAAAPYPILAEDTICHYNYGELTDNNIETCAAKCRDTPGCNEFSVGTEGDVQNCRYANDATGCTRDKDGNTNTTWPHGSGKNVYQLSAAGTSVPTTVQSDTSVPTTVQSDTSVPTTVQSGTSVPTTNTFTWQEWYAKTKTDWEEATTQQHLANCTPENSVDITNIFSQTATSAEDKRRIQDEVNAKMCAAVGHENRVRNEKTIINEEIKDAIDKAAAPHDISKNKELIYGLQRALYRLFAINKLIKPTHPGWGDNSHDIEIIPTERKVCLNAWITHLNATSLTQSVDPGNTIPPPVCDNAAVTTVDEKKAAIESQKDTLFSDIQSMVSRLTKSPDKSEIPTLKSFIKQIDRINGFIDPTHETWPKLEDGTLYQHGIEPISKDHRDNLEKWIESLTQSNLAGVSTTGTAAVSTTGTAGVSTTGTAGVSVTGTAGVSTTGTAGVSTTGTTREKIMYNHPELHNHNKQNSSLSSFYKNINIDISNLLDHQSKLLKQLNDHTLEHFGDGNKWKNCSSPLLL